MGICIRICCCTSFRATQMTSYKLTIQYVGTRYAGWQIQRNQRTVQGTLKEALGRLTGETVSVIGAGRTDSGVHALGQVAQIRLHKQMEARRLQRALNAILPPDIRIASARPETGRAKTLRLPYFQRPSPAAFSLRTRLPGTRRPGPGSDDSGGGADRGTARFSRICGGLQRSQRLPPHGGCLQAGSPR